MLQISDSAFQAALIAQAKGMHKLAADYRLPEDAAGNSSRVLQKIFRCDELQPYFPEYPLGTDLTTTEQELVPALEWLKSNMARTSSRARVLYGSICTSGATRKNVAIERLGLDRASGIGDRLRRRLIHYALTRTGKGLCTENGRLNR